MQADSGRAAAEVLETSSVGSEAVNGVGRVVLLEEEPEGNFGCPVEGQLWGVVGPVGVVAVADAAEFRDEWSGQAERTLYPTPGWPWAAPGGAA